MLPILIVFLTLIPIVNSSGAKNRALAGEKVWFGLPIEYYAGLYVTIDVVGFIHMMVDVRKVAKNRAAFVRDALYKSMYAGKGNYSVLVFNLRKKYKWYDEPALDNTLYTSFEYAHNIYAIWVFQDTAIFENLDDDDPKVWAYYGTYKKSGGNITFYNIQEAREQEQQNKAKPKQITLDGIRPNVTAEQ